MELDNLEKSYFNTFNCSYISKLKDTNEKILEIKALKNLYEALLQRDYSDFGLGFNSFQDIEKSYRIEIGKNIDYASYLEKEKAPDDIATKIIYEIMKSRLISLIGKTNFEKLEKNEYADKTIATIKKMQEKWNLLMENNNTWDKSILKRAYDEYQNLAEDLESYDFYKINYPQDANKYYCIWRTKTLKYKLENEFGFDNTDYENLVKGIDKENEIFITVQNKFNQILEDWNTFQNGDSSQLEQLYENFTKNDLNSIFLI